MAKSGRPPKDTQTRGVRVYEDLGEMLAWIAEFDGETIAEIVDPILRPTVEDRFEVIRHRVEQIKAAKAGTVLVPDLGGEG